MITEPINLKLTVKQHAAQLKSTYDRIRGKTDGCTLAPDFNFQECCIEHDLHYTQNPEKITRAEADRRLRDCIREKNSTLAAWLYWIVVRLFGGFYW